MKSFLTSLLLVGISKVKGHSWAECSDYTAAITGQDYSRDNCVGYIRGFGDYGSSSFGADTGTDHRPSSTGNWCQKTISTPTDYSGSYSATYPMASYTVGDTIRIVWPAKNHANYECFGNIPDNSMKIFVYDSPNPTADLTYSGGLPDAEGWTLVHDWHDGATPGTDGVPFQNCPKFCEDTGNAPCYGDLTLDEGIITGGDGVYTFLWYWAFNNAADVYTTCWEADVSTNGAISSPGDDDDDDDTDDDDDEALEVGGYHISMPCVFSGATYSANTAEDAIEDLYASWSLDVSIGVEDLSESGTSWNATFWTETSYPIPVTAAARNGSLCSALISAFGAGTCFFKTGEITISEFFVTDDDFDSTPTVLILVGVAVVVILICVGGLMVMQRQGIVQCVDGAIIIGGDGQQSASSSKVNINSSGRTQTNIVSA